jgi:membrane protease YdiL (CAAX protease family)
MRIGASLLVSGLILILFGLFAITRARPCLDESCGLDLNSTTLSLGLVLLALAVARLIWTGWHGSGVSWLVAAPAAGVLTWTIYEVVRQGVPLYGIGVLGEMTAPTLSVAVGVAVIVSGLLRQGRSSRDVARR